MFENVTQSMADMKKEVKRANTYGEPVDITIKMTPIRRDKKTRSTQRASRASEEATPKLEPKLINPSLQTEEKPSSTSAGSQF